ncbi:MAG: polysaccharide deacetylase family protein [Lentimicrobiaceae bacterium]|nr:polysaccharide deacetylase family protein [Lentimicrobiaceae bacterium]
MILLYSEKKTKRLEYIVNHIFTRILGVNAEICTSETDFERFFGYKINYSYKKYPYCLTIKPHSLLFETDICPQSVVFSEYENVPICFQTKEKADLPFDIFAASFYFLSRYEEYLFASKDVHQRFDATNSVAYKNNFLHLPLVDCWVEELKNVLKKTYPRLKFSSRKFSFTPTYDIDVAFAYTQKSVSLQMAGYAKLLLNLDLKKIATRTKVLLKKEEDPYYAFDYLEDMHRKYQLRPCYFFLAAEKKSKYDRNPAWENKAFQKLIRYLSFSSEIGLHASYYSKENPERIGQEKEYLQRIANQPIVKNRFHFLRFNLPDSYRHLLTHGITEDYSMGYADHIGFRAGTCTPFLFFDLAKNTTANLLIYPLLCMEQAFLKCRSVEEITQIFDLHIEQIKKYGGTLTTLFHNHAFDEKEVGKKWKNVLEYVFTNLNGKRKSQ